MGFRNERWHDADLDRAGFVGFDRGDELNAVAEFLGETDVGGCDFFDALDEDILRIDPKTVGERGEDDGLVRGVPAVDIERGVGLGVTELLSLGEDRREIQTLACHAREDVVARAVENSMDRLEAVSDESLAHRFDNRNSPGNGGFIKNRHALLAGEFENLAPMLGEQGLVTGYNDLPRGDGFFDKRQRDIDAAHQLHDDLDRRISEDFVRIGGEKRSRSLDITGLGEIANGDFFDLEGRADALLEERAVALEVFVNPRAHRAEACESDADWFAHLKGEDYRRAAVFL